MTEKPLSSITGKNTFRVDRQVVLPFRKSVEIALQSIRVRFFRSMITTMSLVLAVSFLSFASVNTDAANGLLQTGDPAHRQALIRAGHDLAEADQTVGSSPKQRWIIMLSLVVCVVGIVNAQLMAVTERFREIGTMKCLGALDRFIVRLFLLEAFMQGAVGAAAGAVIGALFALANGMYRFGMLAVTAISWPEVGSSVLIAVGTGCLLSVGGALYPALLAARMQPVDAMRAEH